MVFEFFPSHEAFFSKMDIFNASIQLNRFSGRRRDGGN
jgi:hypothetical protein